MTTAQPNSAKGFMATLAAAAIAAVASSLCCIGPLIYLVFGVSAAGLSGVERLGFLQYPMLALSSVLIVMGFWRLYFSKRPFCSGRVSRTQMLWAYWIALPVVLFFQLYPFVLPWLLEMLE
ncbi:Hg(II) uptake system permease component MerT family protein [Leminorella grimontii]|uniref:Hg(II) uptake system permease component MerT family protein n=1 Tax=Leminorella grimontii TaxID=82981 RepID=A0AAV5N3S1_9GAMM|nr:membrane protein [Leminorella grimontii]GKX56422.1 Hg(II) uptake system permease component MerT family protein [Leminorella grimontii]GKX59977.1 Hg(II) uptake system permease component MerT family protein [Leminorella grimontii]